MNKATLFKAIAVSSSSDKIISPCGVCRQFIREFCSPRIPIFMMNSDGEYRKMYLKDLLPFGFGPDFLDEE